MPDQEPNMREKNRRRPCRVNVRFTPEDYAHLREQARIADRTPAAHLRQLAMGIHLREIQRFPEEIQRALKALGSDLNELAHQANLRHVRKEEVEALRGEVSRTLCILDGQAALKRGAEGVRASTSDAGVWKRRQNGGLMEPTGSLQGKEE
jgi:hypothetical protein